MQIACNLLENRVGYKNNFCIRHQIYFAKSIDELFAKKSRNGANLQFAKQVNCFKKRLRRRGRIQTQSGMYLSYNLIQNDNKIIEKL